MLNIGYKHKIKPHQNLASFCKSFTDEVFPEYELKISQKEDDFRYSFERDLVVFRVVVGVSVIRKNDSIFGALGFNVSCNMSNKYMRNGFQYFIEDENSISADFLMQKIKNTDIYREFYFYGNLFKSWNVIFVNYNHNCFLKNIPGNYKVISPFKVVEDENVFNLIPAIIQYDIDAITYQKRFDFTLILSYNLTTLFNQEFKDDDDAIIYIGNFKLVYKGKEIVRKISSDEIVYNPVTKLNIESLFSTKNNHEGIFNDINNIELSKIILQYKIASKLKVTPHNSYEEYEFKYCINKIQELWKIYKELAKNNKMNQNVIID